MERLIRVLGILTRWGLGLCALLAVLVALYVSLGRELVPLVAEYRAEVEQKAEAALGMPVHIGALEGRWSGLAPVLRVRDVQLGEGAGALRLDEVKVVPDLWASLMARQVRLAQVELGGLQLNLHEDENGRWSLKGLPVKDDQPLDVQQLQSGADLSADAVDTLSIADATVAGDATIEGQSDVVLGTASVGKSLVINADNDLSADSLVVTGNSMLTSGGNTTLTSFNGQGDLVANAAGNLQLDALLLWEESPACDCN